MFFLFALLHIFLTLAFSAMPFLMFFVNRNLLATFFLLAFHSLPVAKSFMCKERGCTKRIHSSSWYNLSLCFILYNCTCLNRANELHHRISIGFWQIVEFLCSLESLAVGAVSMPHDGFNFVACTSIVQTIVCTRVHNR